MGREESTHGCPNQKSEGQLDELLLLVLDDDAVGLDLLHHRLRQDVDLRLLERRLGVVDELLAEHGQHGRQRLDERDLDLVGKRGGVPLPEVFGEEVVQLARDFDARGAAAYDDLVCVKIELLGE